MGKMSSKLASQKKELGHAEERTFNAYFGSKSTRDTNFSSASADNHISNSMYQGELAEKFGLLEDYSVSLKSGKTWQFHLGRIDELSPLDSITITKTKKDETRVVHSISFFDQLATLKSQSFWNKYLGKGNLLCYNNKQKSYTFFKMKDVIKIIVNETKWKLLETGRLKGYLEKEGKSRSVLTFEYRRDKNQFVLGAHGGKSGFLFFQILKEKIISHNISFHSETITNTSVIIPKREYQIPPTSETGSTFFDNDYLYICIKQDVWKKVKLKNI